MSETTTEERVPKPLTALQQTVVDLFECCPDGWVEDRDGRWWFKHGPAGSYVRVDGRAVYTLQQRGVLASRPHSSRPGAALWRLNPSRVPSR